MIGCADAAARSFARNYGLRGRKRCSAGFQTCCIAGFQAARLEKLSRSADLEIRATADLEVCATGGVGGLYRVPERACLSAAADCDVLRLRAE
jgi:hypothetical protein